MINYRAQMLLNYHSVSLLRSRIILSWLQLPNYTEIFSSYELSAGFHRHGIELNYLEFQVFRQCSGLFGYW